MVQTLTDQKQLLQVFKRYHSPKILPLFIFCSFLFSLEISVFAQSQNPTLQVVDSIYRPEIDTVQTNPTVRVLDGALPLGLPIGPDGQTWKIFSNDERIIVEDHNDNLVVRKDGFGGIQWHATKPLVFRLGNPPNYGYLIVHTKPLNGQAGLRGVAITGNIPKPNGGFYNPGDIIFHVSTFPPANQYSQDANTAIVADTVDIAPGNHAQVFVGNYNPGLCEFNKYHLNVLSNGQINFELQGTLPSPPNVPGKCGDSVSYVKVRNPFFNNQEKGLLLTNDIIDTDTMTRVGSIRASEHPQSIPYYNWPQSTASSNSISFDYGNEAEDSIGIIDNGTDGPWIFAASDNGNLFYAPLGFSPPNPAGGITSGVTAGYKFEPIMDPARTRIYANGTGQNCAKTSILGENGQIEDIIGCGRFIFSTNTAMPAVYSQAIKADLNLASNAPYPWPWISGFSFWHTGPLGALTQLKILGGNFGYSIEPWAGSSTALIRQTLPTVATPELPNANINLNNFNLGNSGSVYQNCITNPTPPTSTCYPNPWLHQTWRYPPYYNVSFIGHSGNSGNPRSEGYAVYKNTAGNYFIRFIELQGSTGGPIFKAANETPFITISPTDPLKRQKEALVLANVQGAYATRVEDWRLYRQLEELNQPVAPTSVQYQYSYNNNPPIIPTPESTLSFQSGRPINFNFIGADARHVPLLLYGYRLAQPIQIPLPNGQQITIHTDLSKPWVQLAPNFNYMVPAGPSNNTILEGISANCNEASAAICNANNTWQVNSMGYNPVGIQ